MPTLPLCCPMAFITIQSEALCKVMTARRTGRCAAVPWTTDRRARESATGLRLLLVTEARAASEGLLAAAGREAADAGGRRQSCQA
jgi:hypothetical protein